MIEVLTPCPDSGEFEGCARRCDFEGPEPVWVEGRGIDLAGWFHVEEILTPQERTARAHAQQQREDFIREKLREAERDLFFGPGRPMFVYSETYSMPDIADVMAQFVQATRAPEPSEPGTTIPPELNP